MSQNYSLPQDPAAKAFLLSQWRAHPVTDVLLQSLTESAGRLTQQAVNGRRALSHTELVFLLEAVAARQELLAQIKSGNIT
jgi:hypothetical protein